MKNSLIAAMDHCHIIGSGNALPWDFRDIPADMAWFRKNTIGKPIIMGRKTFESIGKKPLPDRLNIVLSHTETEILGCEVANNIHEALEIARQSGATEVMIIGGREIYMAFEDKLDRIYLTRIDHEFEGDVDFPLCLDPWEVKKETKHKKDKNNKWDLTFQIRERRE